jgi:hypothetical protein
MEEVMMQKAGLLFALVLFFSVAAAAQETPKVEVFGGYSNLISYLNDSSLRYNLNGVHFSAAENLNSWFGGVLDFSTHFGTVTYTSSPSLNVNTQSIMYGPRFAYRKSRVITPSAHVLLGGVRGSRGFDGISVANWRFAVGLGGEVDVRINDRMALRLIQADYIPTHFENLRQDNLRLSAGFVFRFPHW